MVTAVLAGFALTACSPEDFNGADGNIPEASNYKADVKVDQDANTATFTIVNQDGSPATGVYPIWNINAGSTLKSTDNGYTTPKIVIAGTYSYTMQVGNRNGVSDGVVEGTFNIENTRYDFSDFLSKLTAEVDGTTEWRVYAAKEFHMGVGPSLTDPTSWWHAQPQDKQGEGLYDDRISFTPSADSQGSGEYKYSAGEDGLTFINTDVTKFGASPGADFSTKAVGVAGAKTDAQYALGYDAVNDMITITLPAQTLFPYIGADSQFDNATTYYVSDITNKTLTVAWEAPTGKWWQLIFVKGADEKTDDQVAVNWCDVNSDLNLGKAFNSTGKMNIYFAPGWNQIEQTFSFANGVYSFTTAGATTDQWQAQFSIPETPVAIAAGEFYDVSVKVNASESFDKLTFKVNKDPDADGDPNFLLAKSGVKLKKGDNVLTFTKVTPENSKDKDNPPSFDHAKMIFDLGGCPAGLTIKISDIIIQKHNPK